MFTLTKGLIFAINKLSRIRYLIENDHEPKLKNYRRKSGVHFLFDVSRCWAKMSNEKSHYLCEPKCPSVRRS